MEKPILLLTLGDPAGVGAEICVKAMLNTEVRSQCHPVLVGDLSPVRAALFACCLNTPIQTIDVVPENLPDTEGILLLQRHVIADGEWSFGKLSAACGKAAYAYIEAAIQIAMERHLPAVVTAPINKEALSLGGCAHAGHTEIFASLTHTAKYAMMLTSGPLRVIHVTTHMSLADVCSTISTQRIADVIRLAWQAVRAFSIRKPRIAVAGLNPHCGEHGLFGIEEERFIQPAIDLCRAEGIDAVGPIPPDSVFCKAAGGLYDIVVAMYHDQGHIPVKILGFSLGNEGGRVSGVNTTVGLPFIRTSVDHGTAFDIAGKGIADETSMIEAILLAVQMSHSGQLMHDLT